MLANCSLSAANSVLGMGEKRRAKTEKRGRKETMGGLSALF